MDNKINKNVLIIGANGYVGPLVCDKFIRESYNVTVIDTFWFGNYLKKHNRLKVLKKDILWDANRCIKYGLVEKIV